MEAGCWVATQNRHLILREILCYVTNLWWTLRLTPDDEQASFFTVLER
jgi:hypothetical protein